MGFDFNIEILHTYVARLLNRPRFRKIKLQENVNFQQKLVGLSNDIYHKDATVVLQVRNGAGRPGRRCSWRRCACRHLMPPSAPPARRQFGRPHAAAACVLHRCA